MTTLNVYLFRSNLRTGEKTIFEVLKWWVFFFFCIVPSLKNILLWFRYDYINSFILDYIAFSIHVSEVGGFYWYIIALQVETFKAQLGIVIPTLKLSLNTISFEILLLQHFLSIFTGLVESNGIHWCKWGICHQVIMFIITICNNHIVDGDEDGVLLKMIC